MCPKIGSTSKLNANRRWFMKEALTVASGTNVGGQQLADAKLHTLDSDFPQYIHDNTDDEVTHFTFLNGYLMSKDTASVNLDEFRTLPVALRPAPAESPGSQI